MTHRLPLSVSTQAGITLTRDRGPGDTNHTLDYIPGSAVRGALAARYLASGGRPTDEVFVHAFIREGVSFSNLYPLQESDRGGTVFPTPLTARSCKYWTGFLARESDQEAMHGVRDMLFHSAIYQHHAQNSVLLKPEAEICEQQTCGQPLDRIRGFAYRVSATEYFRREARTRLMARVAIDRRRRAAAEGILYSLQAITEDQWFCGDIRSGDEAPLQEIQSRYLTAGPLRAGVAKTRGLGMLRYQTKEINTLPLLEQQRFGRCDTKFKELIEKQRCPLSHDWYFSVTLDADCILPDPFLRYYSAIPSDEVANALGLPPASLTRLAYAAATRPVRGWNTALGMPKGDAVAISMGSAFLFAYTGLESQETLIAKLAKLEASGLGVRRGEGFGRLTVAHPFHWEAAEKGV